MNRSWFGQPTENPGHAYPSRLRKLSHKKRPCRGCPDPRLDGRRFFPSIDCTPAEQEERNRTEKEHLCTTIQIDWRLNCDILWKTNICETALRIDCWCLERLLTFTSGRDQQRGPITHLRVRSCRSTGSVLQPRWNFLFEEILPCNWRPYYITMHICLYSDAEVKRPNWAFLDSVLIQHLPRNFFTFQAPRFNFLMIFIDTTLFGVSRPALTSGPILLYPCKYHEFHVVHAVTIWYMKYPNESLKNWCNFFRAY